MVDCVSCQGYSQRWLRPRIYPNRKLVAHTEAITIITVPIFIHLVILEVRLSGCRYCSRSGVLSFQ